MVRLTKILCILLVLGMLVSSLAACGSTSSNSEYAASESTAVVSSNASTAAPSLEQYDLKVVSAGDTPPDNDLVNQEISKISKDELNINLSIDYTPWTDYFEKTKLRAASGEQFDIYLEFGGALQGAIARKQAVPIDEYLAKAGPELQKVISKSDWDDVTIDGKICGVPAVYSSVYISTMAIRKDLREKYGLPVINTLADLEAYFEAVLKNEKGMIPMSGMASNINRFVDFANNIPEVPYFSWAGGSTNYWILIDSSQNQYKVENYFKSPQAKALVQWMAKAYKNGWTDKDILVNKDPGGLFKSGKSASTYASVYDLQAFCPELTRNVPNGEVEIIYPYAEKKTFKSFPTCNNFACISGTSKNPERAVMFLNWLRKSKANYDLFKLGIKGKHWNPVGDDQAELIGVTDISKRPYAPTEWWTEQMNWDRGLTINPKPYSDAIKLYSSKQYEVSPLANFTVNSDNIKTEVAQLNTVITEKFIPVMLGVLGTDADFQAAIAAIDAAGMDKVIADIQKQVENYSANDGK